MSPIRDSAAHDDLSALAWVQDELRKTLESAHKALRRTLREAAAAAGSDLDDVEPTGLRQARQLLHEGVGALQLVNLPEGATLLGASEALVQRYVAKPQKLELAGVEAVEQASFALIDYIGRRLAGQPVQAVALFAPLQRLLTLSGAERIHPADLWALDWQWRDVAAPPIAPRAADPVMQAEFERRLLTLVKQNSPEAAQALARDCAMLAAGAASTQEATLWRVAAAFFEAWGRGQLPQDLYVKRSASRVMSLLRARVRGELDLPERLALDLLFFCAHAAPAAPGAPPAVWLPAVQAAYRLAPEAPVDYSRPRYGLHDPALVQQARKRVGAAKEAWSAVAGNEPHQPDNLVEVIALLSDSIRRLAPQSGALGEALLGMARDIGPVGRAPSAALAMEVATSLLYLEAALEAGELDVPEQTVRAEALAARIAHVHAGRPAQALEPWMEELYRRVSDRQTLGSVVHELRSALSDVERQIDLYFRSPTENGLLAAVPTQLGAMRGVLSVLDVKPAEQAVLRMRDDIDRLLQTEIDPAAVSTQGTFQRLAGNLGALGFLIDMLSVQPLAARQLFRFDPLSGTLAPVMGRSARAPDLVDRAQAIALAVQREGTPLEQVSFELDALSREARASHSQPALTDSLESAQAVLTQAGEAGAGPDTEEAARQQVLLLMNDFVATATGPVGLEPLEMPQVTLPAAAAPRDFQPTGLEDDEEMRAVFLEESREVLGDAADTLAELAEHPTSLALLTTLRRAFHTLKGSARMVGLSGYGEAAWSCEQLYNHWLAEQAPASADLRTFSGDACAYFSAWTDAIERQDAEAFAPEPVVAAAETLRLARELMRVPLPGQALAETPRQSDAMPLDEGLDLEVPTASPAMPLFERLQATQPMPMDMLPPQTPAWLPTAPLVLPPETLAPAALPALDLERLDLVLDGAEPPPAPAAEVIEATAPTPDTEVVDLELDWPAEPAPSPVLPVVEEALPVAEAIDLSSTLEAHEFLPEPPRPEPEPELAAAPEPEEEPEAVKVIGDLRLTIPLFNIFLQEADELSRHLNQALALWSMETGRPVGADTVALAHSLAGSSAAVGFSALSGLARQLELALEQSDALGGGEPADAELFTQAADEIRRLLHQFAAGFLQSPPPELGARLADWRRAAAERARLEPVSAPEEPALALDVEIDVEVDVEVVPRAEPDITIEPEAETEAATPAEPEPALVPEPEVAVLAGPPVEIDLDLAEVLAEPSLPAEAALPVESTPLAPPVAPLQDQIDSELFPIFEEEAETLLPQLAAQLLAWRAAPQDSEAPAACMRSLHTLKGGARLAGAMHLGEAAHACETAVAEVLARDGVSRLEGLEALQHRFDRLAADFDALRSERGVIAVSAFGLMASPLSQMAEWSPSLSLAGDSLPAEEAPPSPPAVASLSLHDLGIALDADALPGEAGDLDLALPPDLLRESSSPAPAPLAPDFGIDLPVLTEVALPGLDRGEPAAEIDWSRFAGDRPGAVAPPPDRGAMVLQPVRVRAALLDRLVNLAGEVSVSRARLDVEVGGLRGSLLDLNDNLDRLNRQLADLALQADSQLVTRREAARAASQAFDPLELDRYTRLQELTRMMAESVNDVATVRATLQRTLQSAEDELAVQARLTRELQGDLLRTRMIEFESLAERLHRVVRQTAKELGKQVRFDIVGGSIEVDRGVLDRVTAAFEHVLRNCVTHGIEMPEQRVLAGKDPTGSIVATLEQEGNEVSVEVRDDGAGLDLARIRARAVEMGLLRPDAKVSDRDLAHFVFAPGLSTAAAVTELSGRGVGMDVVRTDVLAMGGRVEARTAPGRNTRIKMVLPLTTVVTQVVVLRAGHRAIAVPSNLVELVQRATPDAIEQAYQEGRYDYGGMQLPFYWLGALLSASGRGLEAGRTQPVVIVRSAQQRVALHVDEVQGTHEVVVKNLGPQLSRLPGLAGMTLLAAGNAALIYNPVALAAMYGDHAHALMQQARLPDGAAALPAQAEPARPAPLVLVVDDSLTVRRVTKRLLEREGYRVTLAKDGLEALEALATERPLAVLSDIEMPRMDGFDLLRNIRSDASLAELPVIMITSRIAEKHRDLALELGASDYLGKPYDEERLLGLLARAVADAAPAA